MTGPLLSRVSTPNIVGPTQERMRPNMNTWMGKYGKLSIRNALSENLQFTPPSETTSIPVKEIDALNITLFNSCINFTNVHVCNYCTKIFVIIVNTCVCRRSVDNKALILSYPIPVIFIWEPPPPLGTVTYSIDGCSAAGNETAAPVLGAVSIWWRWKSGTAFSGCRRCRISRNARRNFFIRQQ